MLEGSAREREVDRVSLERGVLQLRAGAQAHAGRAEQAEQRRVVQQARGRLAGAWCGVPRARERGPGPGTVRASVSQITQARVPGFLYDFEN